MSEEKNEGKGPQRRKFGYYPKKCRMLQVRDCTVAICNGNNPGAVMLSVFLFWFEYPHHGDIYQEESGKLIVRRTQEEIKSAACSQIDVKTIHDTATPLLHLLGYLNVTEQMGGNLYTVDMNCVIEAFAAYENGTLHAFLKSQLESAPIEIPRDQLESALINKRALYLQLERTLIQIRENSNCKRGRKPRREAAIAPVSEKDRPIETYKTITKRPICDAASADITDTPVIHPLYPFLSFDDLHHPTVMAVTFEDDDRAEITNDGYALTAKDVVAELEAKGITVQVRTEHRRRVATIDTTHTEVNHVDGLSGEDIRGCTGDHHHSSTHGSSLHALGEMGGQTTPETPGTTTQVQAQEASISDSYSHATTALPSVSFLEAGTALEAGSQENVGAADENEYHSQCVNGSDTATPQERAAQGATNDARDSLADAVLAAGDGAAGDHRRPVVGAIHGAHGHQAGPEGQSVLRASNPAVQQPDGDSPSPGTASRSAGERRTGERGARPDTGDDRSVVPNGAAGDRAARGRGGKGTGVAPPVNTTLALPDEGAAWPNVETAILIAEHLRKRAFAPKQREAQEAAARKMFQVHAGLSREQFHNAFESRNDPWWIDHNGPLTIKDLCANDRLQKEMDRLASGYPSRNAKPKQEAPSQRPAPKPTGSPTATGPYTIDEERNKRNIERLLSGVPAKKLVPVVIPMPVMD